MPRYDEIAKFDCKNVNGDNSSCRWWYDLTGVCQKPGGEDCPLDIHQPQQAEYEVDRIWN